MHLRRWLALGAVVWSSLTPRPAHADDAVRAVRLVDLAAGRTSATIIDGSRRRRIARGAGVQVQDVNRLMKQFLDMQRMMKQLKGSGLRRLMGAFRGGSP